MTGARPYMQLRITELEELFQKKGNDPSTLNRLKQELKHRQVPRAQALLARVEKAQSQGDLLAEADAAPQRIPQETSNGGTRSDNLRPAGPGVCDKTGAGGLVHGTPSNEQQSPAKWTAATPAQSGASPLPTWPTVPPRATSGKDVSQVSAASVTAEPVGLAAPAPFPSPKSTATAQPKPLPQISLEDACRILKVGVGDAWEKIEAARQKVVLKSSPWSTHEVSSTQLQVLLDDARRANDAAIVIAARRSGRN